MNGDRCTLHPQADEQKALAVILECRGAGFTYRAIALELNRLQLPTRAGSAWQHQYVQGVLATIARHEAPTKGADAKH